MNGLQEIARRRIGLPKWFTKADLEDRYWFLLYRAPCEDCGNFDQLEADYETLKSCCPLTDDIEIDGRRITKY